MRCIHLRWTKYEITGGHWQESVCKYILIPPSLLLPEADTSWMWLCSTDDDQFPWQRLWRSSLLLSFWDFLSIEHTASHFPGAPRLIQLRQLESNPVRLCDLCSRLYCNLSNANVNVSEIQVCRTVSSALVERARMASCWLPLQRPFFKNMQLKLEMNTVAVFNVCRSKRGGDAVPSCVFVCEFNGLVFFYCHFLRWALVCFRLFSFTFTLIPFPIPFFLFSLHNLILYNSKLFSLLYYK